MGELEDFKKKQIVESFKLHRFFDDSCAVEHYLVGQPFPVKCFSSAPEMIIYLMRILNISMDELVQ